MTPEEAELDDGWKIQEDIMGRHVRMETWIIYKDSGGSSPDGRLVLGKMLRSEL